MKDNNFNFEGVDISRQEEEGSLLEFIKLYSYYLSDYTRSYCDFKKAKQEKYKRIRFRMTELAKKGSPKAIAFYLHHEDKENWDEEIVQLAKSIENKQETKSPEEWEVVAGLHYYDKVYVMINDIENVKQLHEALGRAWMRFDELENEYHHGRYVDVFTSEKYDRDEFVQVVRSDYHRLSWLLKRMRDETYTNAIRHAQVGYYGRYIKNDDVKALWSYLELKKCPYDLYIPYVDIKEIYNLDYCQSNANFYCSLKKQSHKKSWQEFKAKIGISKDNVVEESMADAFARVRSLNLLSHEGYTGCSKYDKLIDKGFIETATEKPKKPAEIVK